MERKAYKCVMLIDGALPPGIIANTAGILGSCNAYGDYIAKAASVEESDFTYLGIGICGDKKSVNKLTGNLPLLR